MNDFFLEKTKEFSKDLKNEIINYRRHFHKYPELSFNEFETSKFICRELDILKIPYRNKIAKTGIVAVLQGKSKSKKISKKIIAIRSDMDALPIKEENNVSYKSKNEGVMHACGHDVHMACLLGVARILKKLENYFSRKIYLIFQPAEEILPGGAKLLLEENIFTEEPEIVMAQHISPFIEVGNIALKKGLYMASCDEIYIKILSEGGHAAMPEKTIDTVLISCHIVIALQQIISRNKPANLPAVLSFGKIETGGAQNIIPKEVKIEGTLRAMNEEWRKKTKEKIKKIVNLMAESMGAKSEVKIIDGYPFLKNDENISKKAEKLGKKFLGMNKVKSLDISMASEDFSYFSQKYPSLFFRIGTKNKKEKNIKKQHTSTFDIDESALEVGSGIMSYLALSL